eukprot:1550103-Prymnesium_polylepis.1
MVADAGAVHRSARHDAVFSVWTSSVARCSRSTLSISCPNHAGRLSACDDVRTCSRADCSLPRASA